MSCVNIRPYLLAHLVFCLLSLICCEYIASYATCAAIVCVVNLANVGRHSQWRSGLCSYICSV